MIAWSEVDRPALYRTILNAYPSWTPEIIARMPITQLAALMWVRPRKPAVDLLGTINAARAAKGLPAWTREQIRMAER